ncbi:MAG TPA: iron transporter FeoA [Desulfotomaculum sp.]|nr:MAG: FeoA family protein [Desulfotomaculum sp. 46_80]HAG10113.1 iron transporter FeoA [Desulfotomaculum sp.]HBY04429.1 iron transporter FeoA [Desulfotomaculum sp.]
MNRTLKDLVPGDTARIKAVNGNSSIRRRIVEMGLLPGVELMMERYAPLGDPIEVKSQGFHLSLRKEEADTIILE